MFQDDPFSIAYPPKQKEAQKMAPEMQEKMPKTGENLHKIAESIPKRRAEEKSF